MLIPLVKLSGPNRKVWFISEDGEHITGIKDNQTVYKFGYPTESREEKIDDSTVVLNLKNDTVYDIQSDNLLSIQLLADENFKYCTIHFSSIKFAPLFLVPYGWRATGSDCEDLKFAPKANSEYNIAVDTLGSTTTLYVMKIE